MSIFFQNIFFFKNILTFSFARLKVKVKSDFIYLFFLFGREHVYRWFLKNDKDQYCIVRKDISFTYFVTSIVNLSMIFFPTFELYLYLCILVQLVRKGGPTLWWYLIVIVQMFEKLFNLWDLRFWIRIYCCCT